MELTAQSELEAVKDELRLEHARYATALSERNASALAAHYASDAVLLPPGGQPISGPGSIRTHCAGICALPYRFEIGGFTLEAVLLAPPYAIEVSRFTGKAHDIERGGTQTYFAKHLVVWRKNGERWLIVRDMYNDIRDAAEDAL